MIRTLISAACLLAAAPPVMASPACKTAQESREIAMAAAAQYHADLMILDDEQAHAFLAELGSSNTSITLRADHLVILRKPGTSTDWVLINDGVCGGFSTNINVKSSAVDAAIAKANQAAGTDL